MLDIAFAKPALPKSGALVLLLEEGGTAASPTGALWQAADAATGGAVGRALAAAEFKGKSGQAVTILAPGAGLSRVVAVGLGKLESLTQLGAEEAGGHAATALGKDAAAALAAPGLSPQQAAGAAHGAVLRSYRFDRYRTKEKPEDKPKLAKLTVLAADPAKAKAAYDPMQAVAEGVYLTRDLVTEPGNILTPIEMASRCQPLTKLGVRVEILGPKELLKLGFGAFMGAALSHAHEGAEAEFQ
jgi:leucyl aminopeptidase